MNKRVNLSTRSQSATSGSNAPKTHTAQKPAKAKTPKKIFNLSERHNFISQTKIDILDHPAEDTDWIGAKEGGKSRPTIIQAVALMEEDYRAQVLMLKKYKTNAATRLHQMVANIAQEIKIKGYDIPDYEKGINETYRMKNKMKQTNQMIEYASFDDYNSIAGIEAKNLGYFPVVIVDEPVLMDDPGKLPTEAEWSAQLKSLKDSVSRSNSRHMSVFNRVVPSTKYHYTMNPWDDHPIIVNAETYFPTESFAKWIELDYLNNNTQAVYVKHQDRLIVRTTKFANPNIYIIEATLKHFGIKTLEEWEDQKIEDKIDWTDASYQDLGIMSAHVKDHLKKYRGSILAAIEVAKDKNDTHQLAVLLGLKYDGASKNDKTYKMGNAQVADTEEITKGAEKVGSLSIAFDIDYRRGLVATPSWYVSKVVGEGLNYEQIENLLVGQQMLIPVYGTPKSAESEKKLIEDMGKVIQLMIDKHQKNSKYKAMPGVIVWVDDNYRHVLNALTVTYPGIGFRLAKKHAEWDILPRQTWLQTAIFLGKIIFDNRNFQLLKDLKDSEIMEGQEKRNEGGRFEKRYDYINSMEYSIYPNRGIIHSKLAAGAIMHYIKQQQTN